MPLSVEDHSLKRKCRHIRVLELRVRWILTAIDQLCLFCKPFAIAGHLIVGCNRDEAEKLHRTLMTIYMVDGFGLTGPVTRITGRDIGCKMLTDDLLNVVNSNTI